MELLSAYEPGPVGMISMPGYFRDGKVLPIGYPLTPLQSEETYNAVPIILGTNRDENKTFMSMNPEYVNLFGVKDQDYYRNVLSGDCFIQLNSSPCNSVHYFVHWCTEWRDGHEDNNVHGIP